jgi:hypothetical protein
LLDRFRHLQGIKAETHATAYAVNIFTNINNRLLPKEFSVEYELETYGFGTDWYAKYHGALTEVLSGSPRTLRPQLTANVTVHDRRFRVKNQGASSYRSELIYRITNQVWTVDKNDYRVRAADHPNEGWRQIYDGPYTATGRNSIFIILILLVFTAIFVSFTVSRRKGPFVRTQSNNK